MSKDEHLALAEQKYDDLQQLKHKLSCYDYEKTFDQICGAARAIRPAMESGGCAAGVKSAGVLDE